MAAAAMRWLLTRSTRPLVVPFTAVLMLLSLSLQAETKECPDSLTTIIGGTSSDAQLACSGAHVTRDFMSGLGLYSAVPVTIILSNGLPQAHGTEVLGTYDPATNAVSLPTLSAARASSRQSRYLGMAVDRDLYRSFVVHEIAHAIAHQTGLISPSDHVSHEYLAYAIQIATMHPHWRNRILRHHDVEGFSADKEISLVYLLLGPDRFAVKSYLHFSRPENGAHFVHRISTGAFRPGGNQ
ncbi:MAG: hypothetical protein H6905_04015 [Hyphomicrobiales bacterium]|nr:hypothetical protein [Hyphomicrobiales bacterium]